MDLHICDFLPCESFVPLHDLAGNVCISKRRFLPWATARAFMSFFIQDFDIYLCASYTSKWLFWYNLGYRRAAPQLSSPNPARKFSRDKNSRNRTLFLEQA